MISYANCLDSFLIIVSYSFLSIDCTFTFVPPMNSFFIISLLISLLLRSRFLSLGLLADVAIAQEFFYSSQKFVYDNLS